MTDKPADEASAETMRDGSRARVEPGESLLTIDRGHYEIDKEIARGGMGRIFTARDRRLGRTVAVKEVLATDAELLARFAREVRLTARLQHPGIVSIYEAGKWQTGESFYAMRLIAGRPLIDVIAESRTLEARLALMPKLLAVAEAMAYAHDQRIIHRDLKPHNVLIGTFGETVVIDWGLAKDLDDASADSVPTAPARGEGRASDSGSGSGESITVFGSIMGTPSYMPVEQATGQPLDERADVYAIGALMYQALAGRAPYLGTTANRVLDKLVAGPPPALASVQPDAPADLVAIVERAMARDARERYRTATELADDLRRYLTGQLVATHAYTTRELLRRWLRRYRAPVAVAAIAMLALLVVGIASYARVVAEKGRADDERDGARRAQLDAERAQAAMLVDRARATVAAGTPARAAPLLAAALDLGVGSADQPIVDALEGQVAAALPAPAWRRTIVRPEALAVTADGSLVERARAEPLAAAAGAPGDASAALDPSGALLAIATPDHLALWDASPLHERARVTGCGADDELAFEIGAVTQAGTVAGVCRALDSSNASQLGVWVPGGKLVLGETVIGGLRGAVASSDGRVAAAIEDAVSAPVVVRDGVTLALGSLPGATAVAIDDAGRYVASGTATGYVQIWEAASGRELAVLTAGEPIVELAFTPDGGLVVASGRRGTAIAWSTQGLLRPASIVDAAAPAGEVRTIVSLRGADRGARWATATPHDIAALDDTGARMNTLVAPAGAVFDAGATIGSTGAIAAIAHRGDPNDPKHAGTASVVVAAGAGSGSGTVVELPLRDPLPIGATLSDDDRYVFAGGQIFDLATRREVGSQGHGAVWGCVTPRPERAVCFVDPKPAGNGQSVTVASFRVPDGGEVESHARGIPQPATSFAFTRDATVIAGCADQLAVVDVMTGEARAPIKLDQSSCVTDLEVSETSGLGAIALASKRVVIWELATGRQLGTLVLDRALEAFALSPDGEFLAIATADGRVAVYHARTRALVASLHVEGDAIGVLLRGLRLAFVSDGELVVTTERRAWRLPWTRWGAPDASWRERSPFVRDGLDVVVKP